jgi:hypothetical protein
MTFLILLYALLSVPLYPLCNDEGLIDFVGSCGDVEWLTCKPKSIILDFILARIPLIAAFFKMFGFFG